jgi:hypothetical protein
MSVPKPSDLSSCSCWILLGIILFGGVCPIGTFGREKSSPAPIPNRELSEPSHLIWIVRGFASSTFGKVNESTPSFNSAPILF